MNNKILVIGDIHQKQDVAEKYIAQWDGPVIFMGDYFDDFYDTPENAARTAEWLKESLTHPNRIHLVGNHDFHYMLPVESFVYCSGYTPQKHNVIKQILTDEDWTKLKYFHAENDCWFSHAGITSRWFSHPVKGITKDTIESVVEQAQLEIKGQLYDKPSINALKAADRYRGGRHEKGGLLWNDWRNSEFFKGITQVVGHTPRENVKCEKRKGGININVDTHLRECIILDTKDSSFEVITIQ